MSVSSKEFKAVQTKELGYWKSTPYPATNPWWYYDRKFIEYIPKNYVTIADVGCGPVPYLMNHNVEFIHGYAVDPLIKEYVALSKYAPYWRLYGRGIELKQSIDMLPDESMEAVFFLNAIDHAKDPWELLSKVVAKLQRGGRLFLYTDINKLPDAMHPHTIDSRKLQTVLERDLDFVHDIVEPSWKFPNSVWYLVGDKR